jgi:hypothetical protein
MLLKIVTNYKLYIILTITSVHRSIKLTKYYIKNYWYYLSFGHKTSFIPTLLIELLYQDRKVNGHVYVC